MKPLVELSVHSALLVVGAALAFFVWTRGSTEPAAKDGLVVEVWGGKAADVQKIEWESKKKVLLESRADKNGRYFVGTVEKTVQVLKPDAPGAQSSTDTAKQDKPKQETVRFVGVGAAETLAASLAPLKAYRALGSFDEGRKKAFGFDEEEGTLRVTIAGAQHSLVVGGNTPGGGDRYARDPENNQLYAISGDLVRSLSYAESRLMERDLHAFDADDISALRIERGGAVRELARVPEKQGVWADAASPETVDETAGNWVNKLAQLRPSEFLEAPPAGLAPDATVVRVDYFEGRRPRGYLELLRVPGQDGKDDYLVRTEHLRWYVRVLRSAGEQVAQDVPSLFR